MLLDQNIVKNIGKRVRLYRQSTGKSRADFVGGMDFSEQQLNRLEKGELRSHIKVESFVRQIAGEDQTLFERLMYGEPSIQSAPDEGTKIAMDTEGEGETDVWNDSRLDSLLNGDIDPNRFIQDYLKLRPDLADKLMRWIKSGKFDKVTAFLDSLEGD